MNTNNNITISRQDLYDFNWLQSEDNFIAFCFCLSYQKQNIQTILTSEVLNFLDKFERYNLLFVQRIGRRTYISLTYKGHLFLKWLKENNKMKIDKAISTVYESLQKAEAFKTDVEKNIEKTTKKLNKLQTKKFVMFRKSKIKKAEQKLESLKNDLTLIKEIIKCDKTCITNLKKSKSKKVSKDNEK